MRKVNLTELKVLRYEGEEKDSLVLAYENTIMGNLAPFKKVKFFDNQMFAVKYSKRGYVLFHQPYLTDDGRLLASMVNGEYFKDIEAYNEGYFSVKEKEYDETIEDHRTNRTLLNENGERVLGLNLLRFSKKLAPIHNGIVAGVFPSYEICNIPNIKEIHALVKLTNEGTEVIKTALEIEKIKVGSKDGRDVYLYQLQKPFTYGEDGEIKYTSNTESVDENGNTMRIDLNYGPFADKRNGNFLLFNEKNKKDLRVYNSNFELIFDNLSIENPVDQVFKLYENKFTGRRGNEENIFTYDGEALIKGYSITDICSYHSEGNIYMICKMNTGNKPAEYRVFKISENNEVTVSLAAEKIKNSKDTKSFIYTNGEDSGILREDNLEEVVEFRNHTFKKVDNLVVASWMDKSFILGPNCEVLHASDKPILSADKSCKKLFKKEGLPGKYIGYTLPSLSIFIEPKKEITLVHYTDKVELTTLLLK